MAQGDDQRGTARIATISALIVVAAFVAGKAERDAILLGHFDIKLLPIFIGISAVTSLPIILLTGRLMARFGPARLTPALNAVSGGLAAGEWLFLPHYPRLIAVVVFFHLALSGAVLVSGFWSIVNERFDVQSAKRHISRIGIGATLGGILGGLIAERSAVYLPRDMILLVLAALQIGCAVTLYLFGNGGRRAPNAAPPPGTLLALRVALRSPLLRNLGVIVVLGAIAAGAMDYVFKADVVAAPSHHGLLRSLAIFYTFTSVITAIFQAIVCGPLLTRLGAPRSVASLPVAITGFSVFALALRIHGVAAIARGAESVTRNSLYRAGYELIYAPLPEDHKRPAKVVLDVGADRLGDLLGAQLVGLIVYATVDPRSGLLIASICVGVIATMVALRLPRSYTRALEDSLLTRAQDSPHTPPPAEDTPPWLTLDGIPSFGQAAEFTPLSTWFRDRRSPRKPSRGAPAIKPPPHLTPPPRSANGIVDLIADLRSGDPTRIRRALAVELAGVAPRCTGMLLDVLLDPQRDLAIRRRLPAILLAGEPSLAAWGLWRALGDPSFDVRYRSGAVLARLASDGHLREISTDDVFEAVRRELQAGGIAQAGERLLDDLTDSGDHTDQPLVRKADPGLTHVFTVLSLALPAEPLRIALHAVQTDDADLRGTALEYLESVLPADLRAQLWPLISGDTAGDTAAEAPPAPTPTEPAETRAPRSHDELLAELRLSYPTILEKLRHGVKPA
ncbi:MAG: hypothetical protein E6J90_28420 [Deltaproteobacteria bacterium]|nr:MAG: hypothetical protein E6J90_28420 [Deltaproteobacteria bacterium]